MIFTRLIIAAGVSRPIILVGHSIGGLYATLFARRYPAEVAGMVLVDPAFRGSDDPYLDGLAPAKASEGMAGQRDAVRGTERCLNLAKKHDVAAMQTAHPSCLDDPPNADPTLHRIIDQQEATSAYYEANASEFRSEFPIEGDLSVDDRELGSSGAAFGAMPLVVLTRGLYPPPFPDFTEQDIALVARAWRGGHRRLASASTRGQEMLVPGSGHYIQNDKPAVVVRSINSVLQAVHGDGTHGN